MRRYPSPYPQSWQLLRKICFLVIWLPYPGIKLRLARFLFMSKPWTLCVQFHRKLWLGFHMNHSVCCSYAVCCQLACHILGFYRPIKKKGAFLKKCTLNWKKGFRLQPSSVWKADCFTFCCTKSYQSSCFSAAPPLWMPGPRWDREICLKKCAGLIIGEYLPPFFSFFKEC